MTETEIQHELTRLEAKIHETAIKQETAWATWWAVMEERRQLLETRVKLKCLCFRRAEDT